MTQEDYDKAYSAEALLIGHKTYLVSQITAEIQRHLEKCEELAKQKAQAITSQAKVDDVSAE